MKIGGRQIDHLVYCTNNLEEAIEDIGTRLGVMPIIGGHHESRGTKNALLNLGHGCYLELLAVDITNTKVKLPRWMGIDMISEPKLTRWSVKSEKIESDSSKLQSCNLEHGKMIEGERRTENRNLLRWKMTEPLPNPEVELLPFYIDWSPSELHPTDNLSSGCRLIDMKFFHPNPERIQMCFDHLFEGIKIHPSKDIRISATISGPSGKIKI